MEAGREGAELSTRDSSTPEPRETSTSPQSSSSAPASADSGGSRGRRDYLPAHRFYGWRVVGMAAIVTAVTAPGQTAGISVFTDHLIRDLGIDRPVISTSYLLGTLGGALALPVIGRGLDRFGVRWVMAVVGAAFGGVLVALSAVSGLIGLTAGFVGLRMLGQGALTLTATTSVALWFQRRRGFAVGLTTAIGAGGISFFPVVFEALISGVGWRTAWLIEGLAVWAIVVPIAALGMRDRPADVGQRVDGALGGRGHEGEPSQLGGWTRGQALRTRMFWAIAAGPLASGLLTTALNFHLISLLGERGLSPAAAAATFIPQTVGSLLATFGFGALTDRVPPKLLICAGMAFLATALLSARMVAPGWTAAGFGIALGASGGSVRAVETAAMAHYFGVAHLGAIRGLVTAMNVSATAFGPLLLALGFAQAGSYGPVLLILAAIPVVVAAFAATAPPPRRREEVHAPGDADLPGSGHD